MRVRNFVIIAAIGTTAAFSAGSASAQGFFDLFGMGRRSSPPPQVQPYAPFSGDASAPVERTAPAATYATYCVRLCDGHFFPLPRGAKPAETCSSFCPAAKTAIYSGSGIEQAVSTSGKRYADLDNAFTYRDKVVDGCTCNGRNASGVARVNVAEDATLRSGDIVATADGMVTYQGKSRGGVAQFTPIDKSRVSSEMRNRLANMRIQPEYNGEDKAASDASSPSAETTGAPAASEKRTQR